MKIGFIGLGNMGAPMAQNLVAAGHDVHGFDLAPLEIKGVRLATTAKEAARGSKIVITMLPDGKALHQVADEILPEMEKGSVLLDCSTVDVKSARAIAGMGTSHDVLTLDAPVSGGIGGARAGSLTFMIGGPEEALGIAQPLFDIMGQKSVHCGEAGAGQAAKICNNMILGINMIGTCEAFALGAKLGLEPAKLFDVVSTSSGYSWVTNNYCPVPGVGPQSPADNDYKPGFAAELMLKDLRLAQMASDLAGADTPLGEAAETLYGQFVEEEDGRGRDFSAMLPRFEKRTRKGERAK